MSDLCLYEFEDIVWDEFSQSGDHIVPHPGFQQADDHSLLGDNHKKPRREETNISYSTKERSAIYVDQGSEKGGVPSLSRRKNTMLEKDSWSHTPSGVFPSSSDGDSIKEESSLASENTTSSSHAFKKNNRCSTANEFCANNAILGEKTTEVDDNSSSDPLGGITHTGNNLDFFENAKGKDSSDFSYYDWPEIENFEDVDRMFRSCDSTFGLGASKEDELDWFSPADNIGGAGDVLKSDFKFSCSESNPVENISPDHDSSKNYAFNDSVMMSAPIRLKDRPWMSERSDSYISFANGPAIANGKEGFIPKAQANEHQKQVKLQNHSEGKQKEHNTGNNSFPYMSKHPEEVVQLSTSAISHQAFPSVHIEQQQHALRSDSGNYLGNHLSYVHSDNSPLSDLTSVNPTSSAVKSETNDLIFPSPKDSSHASNQLPSMDGSHDPSLRATARTVTGKREKLHNRQVSRSTGEANAVVDTSLDGLNSMAKEVQYPGRKSESHSDIEGGSLFIPAEFGSSNIQESSTMSSGVDDISLEAASFRQLQLVMEQLDLRTKICIRDSLYRLARSAELRHNHANLKGSCGDGRDANGRFMAEGGNDFMDIETDTNPIDRSVAHLLFHRPSETSPVPAHDPLPFKSPST